MIICDRWGEYDDTNFSMYGCSPRNRLAGKELEARYAAMSKGGKMAAKEVVL